MLNPRISDSCQNELHLQLKQPIQYRAYLCDFKDLNKVVQIGSVAQACFEHLYSLYSVFEILVFARSLNEWRLTFAMTIHILTHVWCTYRDFSSLSLLNRLRHYSWSDRRQHFFFFFYLGWPVPHFVKKQSHQCGCQCNVLIGWALSVPPSQARAWLFDSLTTIQMEDEVAAVSYEFCFCPVLFCVILTWFLP